MKYQLMEELARWRTIVVKNGISATTISIIITTITSITNITTMIQTLVVLDGDTMTSKQKAQKSGEKDLTVVKSSSSPPWLIVTIIAIAINFFGSR